MRSKFNRFSTGLLLILSSGGSAYADFPDCPTGGQAALEQWRDQAVDQFLSGFDPTKKTFSPAVTAAINSCFPNQVPKCLERLATASLGRPNVDYGSLFPPSQKSPPNVFKGPPGSPPGSVQIPPNIEDLIKGTAQPPQGTGEQVDYKKWKVAKYKSRSTGGFDLGDVGPGNKSTESLMLIYVPGDSSTPKLNFDRWINIGLTSDFDADRFKPEPQKSIPDPAKYATDGDSLPETLTMLTLQKPNPATGAKARILFQNFNRPDSAQPYYTGSPTTPNHNGQNVQQCTFCHSNGMRAISPLGYFPPGTQAPTLNDGNKWMAPDGTASGTPVPQLPSTTQAVISDMNNIMSSYGPVDWGTNKDSDGKTRTFYDAYAAGASLGPMNPARPRDDEFLNRCMNLRPSFTYSSIRGVETKIERNGALPDKNRVKAAMNCAMCHGTMRSPIGRALSRTEVEFKILVDRSMPLGSGASLTDADRLALVSCLYEEQDDNDKAWYKSQSCTSSTSQLLGGDGLPLCPPDSASAPLGQAGDLSRIVNRLHAVPRSTYHAPNRPTQMYRRGH